MEMDAGQRGCLYIAAFRENPFILCRGDTSARADADLDRTSESNRGESDGCTVNHSDFLALQYKLFQRSGMRRHDIPIGFHISQLPKQFICDW